MTTTAIPLKDAPLVLIGYAKIKFVAGAPTYDSIVAPLSTTKASVGFDTNTAPVDNGAGDTTLTLSGGVAGAFTLVDIHPNNAAVASALQSFGYTFPTANSIRITSLQEGAAGAVSALTDVPFTIAIFALSPNIAGG